MAGVPRALAGHWDLDAAVAAGRRLRNAGLLVASRGVDALELCRWAGYAGCLSRGRFSGLPIFH